MKVIESFLISVISYLIFGLASENLHSLTFNFGSLWVNITFYIAILLGFVFLVLFKKIKFLKPLFSIVFLVYLISMMSNDVNLLKSNLIVYLFIVNMLSYFEFSFIKKQRKENVSQENTKQ